MFKGEMLSVFFFSLFLVLRVCCCFFAQFSLGPVFEIHFRERTFVFGVLLRSCVFGHVLPMFFLSIFVAFRPEHALKNSLLVRFFLFGSFSLFSGPRRRLLCLCFSFLLFQEIQIRANRTPHFPPHVFVGLFVFPFSVPAAFVLSPILAVRPFFSGVLSGCHSGPCAFWNFGFSRNFVGLELARPL